MRHGRIRADRAVSARRAGVTLSAWRSPSWSSSLALAALLAWTLRLSARARGAARDAVRARRPADAVALKRLLRTTVHRDLLSTARFSRESVMEACPLPVLAIDPDVRVARANAAADAAFGAPIGGRPVDELSTPLHEASSAVLGGPPVASVELRGPDGRIWLAALRSYPAGAGRAAVAVLSDVSEQVDYREARRVFSAAVSHELRTPLQRIRGLVETLGLPLDDGERQELTDAVQDEVVQHARADRRDAAAGGPRPRPGRHRRGRDRRRRGRGDGRRGAPRARRERGDAALGRRLARADDADRRLAPAGRRGQRAGQRDPARRRRRRDRGHRPRPGRARSRSAWPTTASASPRTTCRTSSSASSAAMPRGPRRAPASAWRS